MLQETPSHGSHQTIQFDALFTRDPSWGSVRSFSYSGGSVGASAGAGGALCSGSVGSEAAGGALCSGGACSDFAGGALCSGSTLSSFATLHLALSALHEHSVFAVQSASLSPLQIFASWFFDPSSQALRRRTATTAITTCLNMTFFLSVNPIIVSLGCPLRIGPVTWQRKELRIGVGKEEAPHGGVRGFRFLWGEPVTGREYPFTASL